MRWTKLGLVWAPDGSNPLARSHAMLPTPILLSNGDIRIFVTCLDADGRGRPFWVDVSSAEPTRVLNTSENALLDVGRPGTFDDNGVAVTSVVKGDQGQMLAYYAGFELSHKVRYRILTGLAISTDEGETFTRSSEAPILDRSDDELLFRCGPFVLRDIDFYRMWYVAGSEWTQVAQKPVPVYRLHYAESVDGKDWPRKGESCLDFDPRSEHGIGRPWVILTEDRYRLIYSIRSQQLKNYTLGYAESPDGLEWKRLDDRMGLKPSHGYFDEGGVMYAATIQTGGALWCFYNGDNFGQGGFGVARLDL